MYLVELHSIIENGENSKVEFKRKFTEPDKIAKEMVAFANTKGGMILFGVDDDREIIGIESEKAELELIDIAAKFHCEPEIDYHTEILCIKNKDVLIIHIPESKRKPHYLINDNDISKNKVYIRNKDKSVIASRETISILKYSNPDSKPFIFTLGKIEKQLIEILKVKERITVKEFKKLANISERRASRTIVNLIRAGILFHHIDGEYEYFTIIE